MRIGQGPDLPWSAFKFSREYWYLTKKSAVGADWKNRREERKERKKSVILHKTQNENKHYTYHICGHVVMGGSFLKNTTNGKTVVTLANSILRSAIQNPVHFNASVVCILMINSSFSESSFFPVFRCFSLRSSFLFFPCSFLDLLVDMKKGQEVPTTLPPGTSTSKTIGKLTVEIGHIRWPNLKSATSFFDLPFFSSALFRF
jgi:hypothetical protein